jgi:type 1 glutamine amidotransferase
MRLEGILAVLRAALLAACTGCESERGPVAAVTPDSPPAGKPRLLVVTYTTGFRHASIPVAERAIAELASSSGDFEVAFARSADDVRAQLTAAALEEFAGVFFANTTGDLGIPDLSAFVKWIGAGHAFVGAHSASDTYKDEPAYVDMLGAAFVRHGAPCSVEVTVEDPTHAATSHLGPSFPIFDEIYELAPNPRTRSHVLLSLDRHPPDGHPEAGEPGDFPLSFTRMHGRGRVFYTALGHGDDVWADDRFRRHVLGGIRWSLLSR